MVDPTKESPSIYRRRRSQHCNKNNLFLYGAEYDQINWTPALMAFVVEQRRRRRHFRPFFFELRVMPTGNNTTLYPAWL